MPEPPNNGDTPRPGSSIGPLDIITLKIDKMAATVDAIRSEANANTVEVNKRIDDVAKEIVVIKDRLKVVEDHKDGHIQQDLDEELQRGRLESGFSSLSSQMTANAAVTRESLDSNERVNRGVCQALGLDYEMLSAPPKSLTQTQQTRIAKAPATLTKLFQRQTQTQTASILILIITILQLALKLLP